ncbi:MAG: hypothetical protein IJY42_01140, partial [Clostridia bacterium]|nr:hypothetical protein [Clostridia bacterium]
MKSVCIDRLIEEIRGCVKRHDMGHPGQYARWLWQNEKGDRELGCNPYGCADAANILYSISDFPRDEEERRGFVETIQGMQDKTSGLNRAMRQTPHRFAEAKAAL